MNPGQNRGYSACEVLECWGEGWHGNLTSPGVAVLADQRKIIVGATVGSCEEEEGQREGWVSVVFS